MKRITFPSIMLLLIAWLSAACGASTQGPATWIDRPLDGAHVPLSSITIQSHASDTDGVASIEFYVSETLIASAPAGGGRLGQATIDWMPPGPGGYTVVARGIDSRGNYGSQASAQIFVEGAGSPTDTPTPAPAQIPQLSVPTMPTLTPALALSGPSIAITQNANCRSGPGTAYDAIDTLMQGQVVAVQGRNDQGNWFQVQRTSGHGSCWVSIVSVVAQGDLSGLPVISVAGIITPEVPAEEGQPAPPPVQDASPPTISNVSIDPTSLQQAGCGSPDTFTISATVTDISGIGNVTYQLNGPGPADGGEGYLSPVGSDSFQATVGPIAGSTGTWSVRLQAVDMASNSAQAGPWSIQISCIQ